MRKHWSCRPEGAGVLKANPFSLESLERIRARLRDEFPPEAGPVPEFLDGIARDGRKAAVAFSGGPDSLFLLLWWVAWFPEQRSLTLVLHYDHGTRSG